MYFNHLKSNNQVSASVNPQSVKQDLKFYQRVALVHPEFAVRMLQFLLCQKALDMRNVARLQPVIKTEILNQVADAYLINNLPKILHHFAEPSENYSQMDAIKHMLKQFGLESKSINGVKFIQDDKGNFCPILSEEQIKTIAKSS